MSKENELMVEFYEKYGEQYLMRNKEQLSSNPRAAADNERQKKVMMKFVEGLPKDAKIFEIGSGGGRDAKFLRSLGYNNITVSDVAEYFLGQLRKEGFNPVKFNLITDEFKEKYDFILCWAVLVHFKKVEAKAAIHKIYGALNDGGRMAFCVKHKEGTEEEWSDYKNAIGEKRYFSFWSKDEVKNVADEIGLKNIEITQYGGARACWIECYGGK